MSSLAIHYTFANLTTINPDEVNTNFADIRDFVNNNMMQVDGSIAFSGWPALPGNVPGGALAPTPKSYVDELPRSNGNLTNGTTSGSGDITIAHGLAATPDSVTFNTSTLLSAGNSGRSANLVLISKDATSFVVRAFDSASPYAALTGVNLTISWQAQKNTAVWTGGNHG